MVSPRDNGADDGPIASVITQYVSGQTFYYYVHSSTTTAYTATSYALPSSTSDPTPQTGRPFPSANPSSFFASNHLNEQDSDDHGLDGMPHSVKATIIAMILLGVAIIVAFSIWFCCGGKARWARRKATRQQEAGVLPLHTISSQPQEQPRETPAPPPASQAAGDLPPPSYEEVVPARHQRLAGGLPPRDDEMEGMVVDGKTPLSEIPFEDVVLDHSPSGSSSSNSSANQSWSARHHNQIGDTMGHTNS